MSQKSKTSPETDTLPQITKTKTSGESTEATTKTETTTKSGSSSRKKSSGSKSKESKSTYGYGYSGYNSGYNGYKTTQNVTLDEIQNRPPVYKRIACVRYVRPMLTYDQCMNDPYDYCGWGYPYGSPYYPGCGECPKTTGILIIPPRSKALYRPAMDEDFMPKLFDDECPSFLKIDGECEKDTEDIPKEEHIIDVPKPPPRPKTPPKPKVDRSKILKRYLHEAAKPKKEKSKTKSHSPPKMHHHHHKKKSEHKKPPTPPKKLHHKVKKKTPPPSPPKEKKKPRPPTPPKEKKKPPPPPPKEKPPPPPPKVEKKPPPPPPPPKVEKKPSSPPKVEKKPSSPKVVKKPTPKPTVTSTSSSSVPTLNEHVHFGERGELGREQHYQGDVVRKGSSYDAITKAAKLTKNSTHKNEAVAPQKRKWKG